MTTNLVVNDVTAEPYESDYVYPCPDCGESPYQGQYYIEIYIGSNGFLLGPSEYPECRNCGREVIGPLSFVGHNDSIVHTAGVLMYLSELDTDDAIFNSFNLLCEIDGILQEFAPEGTLHSV